MWRWVQNDGLGTKVGVRQGRRWVGHKPSKSEPPPTNPPTSPGPLAPISKENLTHHHHHYQRHHHTLQYSPVQVLQLPVWRGHGLLELVERRQAAVLAPRRAQLERQRPPLGVHLRAPGRGLLFGACLRLCQLAGLREGGGVLFVGVGGCSVVFLACAGAVVGCSGGWYSAGWASSRKLMERQHAGTSAAWLAAH